MPRFFTGDELGNIKSLYYRPDQEIKTDLSTLHDGSESGKAKAIQALSTASTLSGATLLAAARADGTVSTSAVKDDDKLEILFDWRETRFKAEQTFVGLSLAATESRVYSSLSNGALRMTTLGQDGTPVIHNLASLPTRLYDWRISSTQENFAYGGDEVELSMWNTEQAFSNLADRAASSNTDTKKRKRGGELFPGEIWRAKNVPNDNLGLRQPVHITSLTYLSDSSSASQHNLLTGTQLGEVRRYDTRSARRPVSQWKGIGKMGGVKRVEKGFAEYEVFVSDKGCNMFALDLRNGGILCGYKGLSGAVTSIAPSPNFVASTSLDRFARIHSTSEPPQEVGHQVDKKGAVLEKIFTKSIPTVVVWDKSVESGVEKMGVVEGETEDEDENIWDGMENVADSEGDEADEDRAKSRNNKKSRAG